ncbi:MAG: hypothetical protein J6D03_04380 [Clostridia bacterium]|nr:hypothetical protein [Clostridia bacterium]
MNFRLLSILKIFTIIVILIVFIIGFNHDQDIDDYAFAVAIGIDSGNDNNLKVNFQFTKPNGGGESGGSSEVAPTFIYTVEASSITSAINLVNNYISKQVNLSHCKVVVFSEEFAQKGIEKEVYTLINDVELRPDTGIIISKCNTKYFIENSKPVFETLVSKYYEIVPATTQITGYTSYAKIEDFFNQLHCTTCEPVAILRWYNF